ncbi:MAG: hypothetical protein VX871_10165 [Pseudomonadota bacterium]|nr:hypothetical protein [Pseudomonadota bacterium]
MLDPFLTTLEQLPLAAALRGSTWLYPLVNATHIIGISLLFGSIVPLDLRLAGFWPSIDLIALRRVLLPVAIFGVVLAAGSGVLLFLPKAADYAGSFWFLAKISLVAAGLANALLLRRSAEWQGKGEGSWPRIAGVASLLLWTGAIVAGRLVGYFD